MPRLTPPSRVGVIDDPPVHRLVCRPIVLRPAVRTVVIALIAVLFSAAVALAHRPATRSETTALVYHASGRYYFHLKVSEPTSIPLRCFQADIATVAHNWGAWAFSLYADQSRHAHQCHTGEGVVIAHLIGHTWYVYWEGSDGSPPTHDGHGLRGVPHAVWRDLEHGLAGIG